MHPTLSFPLRQTAPRAAAALLLAVASAPLPFLSASVVHGEDEHGDRTHEAPLGTFEFERFCVASLSGNTLTISSGGVSLVIDVARVHGNLRRLAPEEASPNSSPTTSTATSTAASTAGTTTTVRGAGSPPVTEASTRGTADRGAGRVVHVKGVIADGGYRAREVEVEHERCDASGTGSLGAPTGATSATTPAANTLLPSGAEAASVTAPARSTAAATTDGRGRDQDDHDDDD